MTNEEAIRMLTRLKDQINFEWTEAQKKMDALKVAIEALSAEVRTQMSSLAEAIKVLPSARRKGKWIGVEDESHNIVGHYCSNCDLPMETEEPTNYCPNCGARMEA